MISFPMLGMEQQQPQTQPQLQLQLHLQQEQTLMHYTVSVQLPPMDIMLQLRQTAMPLPRPQHFHNMVCNFEC